MIKENLKKRINTSLLLLILLALISKYNCLIESCSSNTGTIIDISFFVFILEVTKKGYKYPFLKIFEA